MTTVKFTKAIDQNANTLSSVQVDTSVYVGTGSAGVPTVKVGAQASRYVMEGVQTAVTVDVVLDTNNASPGDEIELVRGTGVAWGTSIIQVVNATTGGTVVSTSSGMPSVKARFDGVRWR